MWSTSFLLGKLALAELSVGHLMLYRFAFACLALVPFAAAAGVRLRREHWPAVLAAAFLGVPVQFLVQFEGLARTTVSPAALMIGAVPILIAASAAVFHGERPSRRLWLALVASTLGAALVAGSAGDWGGRGPSLLGDVLVLASLMGGVAWVLISRRLMSDYAPVVATSTVLFAGTAMLAAWVLAVDGLPPVALSRGTWLSIVALGVVATTATSLLWNWGLQEVPSSRAGVFVNLEPLFGTALGLLVLDEQLGPTALVGGALILAAAVSVSVSPQA